MLRMHEDKTTTENWMYVFIGWGAGAFVAVGVTVLGHIPGGIVVLAMVLIPLIINWANDMTKAVRGH